MELIKVSGQLNRPTACKWHCAMVTAFALTGRHLCGVVGFICSPKCTTKMNEAYAKLAHCSTGANRRHCRSVHFSGASCVPPACALSFIIVAAKQVVRLKV